MYHLLDLYQLPSNRDDPVVCVDEKSKQLLASKRPDLPIKPGQVIKIDDEYERKGMRNLFVAVEPLAGWRTVQVAPQRKKADFVEFIRQLLQGRYRRAKRVHWVLDKLNSILPRSLSMSSDKSVLKRGCVGLCFTTPRNMPVG
jgi:hypothetical protein